MTMLRAVSTGPKYCATYFEDYRLSFRHQTRIAHDVSTAVHLTTYWNSAVTRPDQVAIGGWKRASSPWCSGERGGLTVWGCQRQVAPAAPGLGS